ncbi:MAG: peptidylprolyl isomerase [Bacteroidaceae bacterium]|nr:peptidylprolyl isomerase [Bacteroidaceae bacterium]MBR4648560.1 peptidylprolyl isomerase [Bacteroidaceae bacterium]
MRYFFLGLVACVCSLGASGQIENVLDEVAWIVGDEPILKSDIEMQRIAAEYNRTPIEGDPYVTIPEELAIQKLFLHQAALDSIEVTEADVQAYVDNELQRQISIAGSERNLENYRNMTMKEIRAYTTKMIMDQYRVMRVRDKIIGDGTATPAEVRRYFKDIPKDSLPTIPTQVEIQIISETPRVTPDEVARVKAELMEYADRVNKGESFALLARMFSKDGSAANGGELGFKGRAELVPEFSSVAFSLTDPKTVSKIVKTEYGYHIIQLIERKGDKINCRHILRTPELSAEEIRKTLGRLDSVANLIRTDKLSFDEAVFRYSEDKDTRLNHGLMAYTRREDGTLTSRIGMDELHRSYQDIAMAVEKMHIGEVSDAFTMRGRNGMKACAIIKLKNRIPEHKADITDDFQVLTDIVNDKRSEEIIQKWIEDKIKTTYVKIKDGWKRSGYRYNWLKS